MKIKGKNQQMSQSLYFIADTKQFTKGIVVVFIEIMIYSNIFSSSILSSANIFTFKMAGWPIEIASEDPRFFRPTLIHISSFLFNFSKVASIGEVLKVKSLGLLLPLEDLASKVRLVKPAPNTQSEMPMGANNWDVKTRLVKTYRNKLEMVFCYLNCSSDQGKLLKFEAEARKFPKFLRSLQQSVQTVKGQNNFW